MIKKAFILLLLPGSVYANDCVGYKQIPRTNVFKSDYYKNIIQSNQEEHKYHGNVVATLVEDYDISVDIIPSGFGFCVVLKAVDGNIGYNDFSVMIDSMHTRGSCEYNAILNHEDKHIAAYLSVIDDMWRDIESSVFNAANSVMPVFIPRREDIDSVIEGINIKLRSHPELVLMKQKIRAAEEIRNKRIDQNEDNSELKKC